MENIIIQIHNILYPIFLKFINLTSPQIDAMEHIMLGLRTSAGLPEEYLCVHCDPAAMQEALSCGNLVSLPDGFVRIPESRFFISDTIISSLV
jgi:hypothetical protein